MYPIQIVDPISLSQSHVLFYKTNVERDLFIANAFGEKMLYMNVSELN